MLSLHRSTNNPATAEMRGCLSQNEGYDPSDGFRPQGETHSGLFQQGNKAESGVAQSLCWTKQ